MKVCDSYNQLLIVFSEEMTIVRDIAAALENGKSLNELLENMTFNTKHDSSCKLEEDTNLQDLSVSKTYVNEGTYGKCWLI